jgi:hypothetical protein
LRAPLTNVALPDTYRRATADAHGGVRCPVLACGSGEAVVVVQATTVVTLRCCRCRFMWAVDLLDLPARF